MARASLLPPGSFPWLVAHEVRQTMRGMRARTRTRTRWLGYALLAGYVAIGCFIGWGLSDVPFSYSPLAGTIILAVTVGMFAFMVAQAVLGSQHTLYEAGDLDLLLSAPMPERTVLAAKLTGIAGAIVTTYLVLLLPILVPVALLGHPALFGAVGLLLALALVAACAGLAITLAVAKLVGPRAARTVGQVTAALLGGALFLFGQYTSNGPRSGRAAIFDWLRHRHLGESGIGALPGKAAFGDPLAILLLCGGGVALFVATGIAFERWFLTSYQMASVRLSRAAPTGKAIGREFRSGLFATIFAKEVRLLLRDPALAFQVVLRIVYLAPLLFLAFGRHNAVPVAPTLAFASVLVIGQLAGSFAWLAISAEDTPDLLTVAPVDKGEVSRAKLAAALAMAAPLGVILPIAVATQTILGAVVTLAMTALAGVAAGYIELKLAKPMPRKSFNQRRGGGAVAAILSMLATVVFGGVAAGTVYLLG